MSNVVKLRVLIEKDEPIDKMTNPKIKNSGVGVNPTITIDNAQDSDSRAKEVASVFAVEVGVFARHEG